MLNHNVVPLKHYNVIYQFYLNKKKVRIGISIQKEEISPLLVTNNMIVYEENVKLSRENSNSK